MSDKNDFGKLMDGLLDSAKKITENLTQKGGEFIKDTGLEDLKDYYPFYSWPPLNLYTCEDESLVFEFGLPGFIKDDVNISFEEDYMLFSAKLSNLYSSGGAIRSFKKKLRLGDIENQKYFVPENKFNRKDFTMHMKNGLLRLVFTALEVE